MHVVHYCLICHAPTFNSLRFRSLHCHLYPDEDMCIQKQQEREKQQEELKKKLAEKESEQNKAKLSTISLR